MHHMRAAVYLFLTVSISAVGAIPPAWAQSLEQNEKKCSDADPDLSIGGCTALIQSGQESDANLAIAFYNRGLAYGNKGQYDLAIADETQAIRLKPDYAQAFYNRGTAYNNKGQYDLAIADETQAIRLKPDYANAFDNRAGAYGNKGQYDLAIADETQAIRLNPDNAVAFNNRGAAYDRKGEYDLAIADYTQAVRLNPDYAIAFGNRGGVYANKGQYDLAIADYTQAVRLKPDDALSYDSRCWTRAMSGQQLDLALADCNKALQLTPNDAHTLGSRGFVDFRMGNFQAAVTDTNAALAANPKLSSSLYVRGLAKMKMSDTAGGSADIAAAEALDATVVETFEGYGIHAPAAKAALRNATGNAAVEPAKGSLAADVMESLYVTKEYAFLKAYYDREQKSDPNWPGSSQGQAVAECLRVMRADASNARTVKTAKGAIVEYTVGGARVTDAGIVVADLKTDKEYHDFIAAAIASVIVSDGKVTDLLTALKKGK